jgi:hypothetical protein
VEQSVMSQPAIENLTEDEITIIHAETSAMAEARRESDCRQRATAARTPAGVPAGRAGKRVDLTWRIAALKRDIAAFEQDFRRDSIPPKYAQRLLWLIAPNANRNPGDDSLDPWIIEWLDAVCADIDW